jgi:hypothetical protein
MILALITITLVAGGSVYEIFGGAVLNVETGSYVVKVDSVERARVWLPRGSYNATVKLLELDDRGLTGVIVILANTTIDIAELSMTGTGPKGGLGVNLRANITLLEISECHISNTTFWRSLYLEELKPILRGSISNVGGRGECTIIVDTRRALGHLYVTPGYWATISVSGPGYSVALVYGVIGRAGGSSVASPSVYDVRDGIELPESPVPVELVRGDIPRRVGVDYRLLLGLLLILFFVVVVEVVSGKRGG